MFLEPWLSGTGVKPKPAEAKRPSVEAGLSAGGSHATVAHFKVNSPRAVK